MENKILTKMLHKANDLALSHRKIVQSIYKEADRRFSCTPSSINCDQVVQSIQYGHHERIDAKTFDILMKESIDFNIKAAKKRNKKQKKIKRHRM